MPNKRVFSENEIEDIVQRYIGNETIDSIRKYYHCRDMTITKILKDKDVKIKQMTDYFTSSQLGTRKKYFCDETYFEKIDTDTKAYWLGFLFADGCIILPKGKRRLHKGGNLEIGLKGSDAYHLYNFAKCINSNHPIKFRDITLGDKKFPSCRISIGSIKIVQDLISLGCVPAKSLILEYPKNLDDRFLGGFLRGYIDGDGTVYSKKIENKRAMSKTIVVLGTQLFLQVLKEKLDLLGIKTSNIAKEKSKAYNLKFSTKTLELLFEFLYKDAEYFLGRKYDSFRDILHYENRENSMSSFSKLSYKILDM